MDVGNFNFESKYVVNEIQKKICYPSGAKLAVSLYYVNIRGPDTFFCKK
jgi:hypothetical protein